MMPTSRLAIHGPQKSVKRGVKAGAGQLNSLFTWFYALRPEERYSMFELWEKAQRQPQKAWDVSTDSGVSRGPLVLLELGTVYPFDTYELEKEEGMMIPFWC